MPCAPLNLAARYRLSFDKNVFRNAIKDKKKINGTHQKKFACVAFEVFI